MIDVEYSASEKIILIITVLRKITVGSHLFHGYLSCLNYARQLSKKMYSTASWIYFHRYSNYTVNSVKNSLLTVTIDRIIKKKWSYCSKRNPLSLFKKKFSKMFKDIARTCTLICSFLDKSKCAGE